MIDIHTHFLWDIDDGPNNIEDTIKILQKEKEEGVSAVVATPHRIKGVFDNTMEDVLGKIEQLKSMEEYRKIGIDIYGGLEIHIYPEMINDIRKDVYNYTINQNGKYVLLELPYYDKPLALSDFIFDLSVLGIKIVLAHVERYIYFWNNIRYVEQLIDNGVVIQMNVESLIKSKGDQRYFVEKLVEKNLVHVFSSDIHYPQGDRPLLSMVSELLGDIKTEDFIRLTTYENPLRIIEGRTVEIVKDENKKRKFWKLW